MSDLEAPARHLVRLVTDYGHSAFDCDNPDDHPGVRGRATSCTVPQQRPVASCCDPYVTAG